MWQDFLPHPLFFWPHHMAYRNLVLQPGVEPQPLAVEAWSPNHGTTREFPGFPFKAALYSVVKWYMQHFIYLSICWYPFGLLPPPSYWEIMLKWTQMCENLFKILLWILLDIYPKVGLMIHLCFWFFEEPLYCFSTMAEPFYISTVLKGSTFSTSLPSRLIFHSFDSGHPVSVWFWFTFFLWLVMLNIFSYACRPFVYVWRIIYSVLCPFLSWVAWFFLLVGYRRTLYILYINRLSNIWFPNIFFHSIGCLFTLLIVSFESCSVVSNSLVTPWTIQFMEFSSPEYWSG